MRNSILILLLFLSYGALAQFGPEQLITTEQELPRVLSVDDIDGDGFLDVVCGALAQQELAWFKNIDGYGQLGPLQPITDPPGDIRGIETADLDGDGDIDLAITEVFLDEIYWQENLDGQGTYGPPQIIDAFADAAFDVKAADVDGDGDLDLLAALSNDLSAVWYENINGQGAFGPRKTIFDFLIACRSIFPVDIDNDGDLDVVANSADQVTISWFENLDGLGNFGQQNIVAGAFSYVNDVYGADIDGDGDNDIVGVTNDEIGFLSWYENLDGQGAFSERIDITTGVLNASSIVCADLDNDGDMDVLYGSTPDAGAETSEVAWCENLDGMGTFSPKQLIGGQLQFVQEVYAEDIDGDGDLDVFATSQNNDKVVWYRNNTILGTDSFHKAGAIKIYPNPGQTLVFIAGLPSTAIEKATVYSSTGSIITELSEAKEGINISHLPNGLYILTLESKEGIVFNGKFIKSDNKK